MIVECKNCGAPLDVERGSAFAQCRYCGHSNKVKGARTLALERPADWLPPPTWTPSSSVGAPTGVPLPYRPQPLPKPPPPKVNHRGCLLGTIAAIAIFGGAVFFQLGGTFPFGGIDETGEPTLGTLDLDVVANTLPVYDGDTSGWWSLDGLGPGCRGSVESSPHLVLRTAQYVAVRLDVTSRTDLVMAVRTQGGDWICDDDSGQGMSPAISTTLGPGEHRVWVGPFASDRDGPFRLTVTGQPIGATPTVGGLSVDGPPVLGVVQVGAGPVHGFWDGSTAPWVDVSSLGPGCRGHVPIASHIAIEATQPRPIRIETAESTEDLVLVVRTPTGRFICDDDSGEGLNSRLEMTAEIGRTAVWVGTFRPDGTANFSLELSEPGARRGGGPVIAPSEPPVLGFVNLDVADWTPVYEGTTRADLDAMSLAPDCGGWVGVAPDLVLTTTVPRAMSITTSSRADLTLIVRGPDGSFVCDDDSGERHSPRVHQSWTAGRHEVWVGARRRRASPYQLVIIEEPL